MNKSVNLLVSVLLVFGLSACRKKHKSSIPVSPTVQNELKEDKSPKNIKSDKKIRKNSKKDSNPLNDVVSDETLKQLQSYSWVGQLDNGTHIKIIFGNTDFMTIIYNKIYLNALQIDLRESQIIALGDSILKYNDETFMSFKNGESYPYYLVDGKLKISFMNKTIDLIPVDLCENLPTKWHKNFNCSEDNHKEI